MYRYCAVGCSICGNMLWGVTIALGRIQINTLLHNGKHLLWLKWVQNVQRTISPILLLQFPLEAFLRKWKAVNLPKLGFSHDIVLEFFYSSVKESLLSSLATQGHKITNILRPKPVQSLFTKFCVQWRLRNCLILKLDTPSWKKKKYFLSLN